MLFLLCCVCKIYAYIFVTRKCTHCNAYLWTLINLSQAQVKVFSAFVKSTPDLAEDISNYLLCIYAAKRSKPGKARLTFVPSHFHFMVSVGGKMEGTSLNFHRQKQGKPSHNVLSWRFWDPVSLYGCVIFFDLSVNTKVGWCVIDCKST